VDPRDGLDDVEERKFLTLRDSNSDRSVVQTIANRYTDCAIPAPTNRESLKKEEIRLSYFIVRIL
jgi:hypothetical protein